MNKFRYTLVALAFGMTASAQTITQAEYFWDTDPGQGSGIAFSAADGNLNAEIEALLQHNISVPTTGGLHTFNVRVKDSDNLWGPVHKQVIDFVTVPTVITLAEAEYFWDTDPGQGNGTAIDATQAPFDAIIENLVKNGITVPTHGLRKFCVRVKDSSGFWGPVHTQIVDVSNVLLGNAAVATIVEGEYFWDADPGQGSGAAFSATDGSFDGVLEQLHKDGIQVAQPAGVHVFNARVKDSFGNWGPLHKQVVHIETTLATEQLNLAGLVLFPNPVSDVLNLKFDTEITSATVYNMIGQPVIKRTLNTTDATIDVSALHAGTYFVTVHADKLEKTIKFIKR